MRRATFLASANDNLLEILDYITEASRSLDVGRTFVRDLRAKCHKLAGLQSTIGRPRPDIGQNIRSFPYKGYLIVFRYSNSRFEVINIIEGHRDIEAYFAGDHRPIE